jgi:hypothetical protein
VDWSKGRSVTVPSQTLDTICSGMERVDFIRIEANGMEPAVFQGMKGLLERDRPDIAVRFNPQRISDPQGFVAQITAHYPVLRHLGLDGRLKPLSVADLLEKRVQEPLLFLTQEKNL